MDLLQLYYFKTIAECQHITKAADKLMISQPSLSSTLARIEAELGVQLFDRQGRNIILNNYGKIVLKYASRILQDLDTMHNEIDELACQTKKRLTIASTDSMFLRSWLVDFMAKNPDLKVRHFVTSCDKLEQHILNGTVDFGIFGNPPASAAFQNIPLWEDEYLVFTTPDNPLAQKPLRSFADFREEAFVALPKSDNIVRSIDILCDAAGFKPNVIFEAERDLIEYSHLPLNACVIALGSTLHNEEDRQLCARYCGIVQLSDAYAHLNITLSRDFRRTPTEATKRLLDYIRQNPIQPWHI